MDNALVEYERCNRRLLETIGRFRRENEAVSHLTFLRAVMEADTYLG